MGLESGNTIADLNSSWPLGTDPKAQGDDHIRLLKRVLINDVATKDDYVLKAGDTMTGPLRLEGTNPSLRFYETDSASGNRHTSLEHAAGDLMFSSREDDGTWIDRIGRLQRDKLYQDGDTIMIGSMADTRYLQLTGDTMTGNFGMANGTKMLLSDALGDLRWFLFSTDGDVTLGHGAMVSQTLEGDWTIGGTLTGDGGIIPMDVSRLEVATESGDVLRLIGTGADHGPCLTFYGGADRGGWFGFGSATSDTLQITNETGTDVRVSVGSDGNTMNSGSSVVTRNRGDTRYAQLGTDNTFDGNLVAGGYMLAEGAMYVNATDTTDGMRLAASASHGLINVQTGGDFVLQFDSVSKYFFSKVPALPSGGSVVVRSTGDERYARADTGAGTVGTYAMLSKSGTSLTAGQTASSGLNYANADGSTGAAVSGTWRCMGHTTTGSGAGDRVSLFRRES